MFIAVQSGTALRASLSAPSFALSASSSKASMQKLTGRKQLLQFIIVDLGFIRRNRHPCGTASSQKPTHIPSGFCRPLPIHACPSWMSQVCSTGSSFFYQIWVADFADSCIVQMMLVFRKELFLFNRYTILQYFLYCITKEQIHLIISRGL